MPRSQWHFKLPQLNSALSAWPLLCHSFFSASRTIAALSS